MISNVSGYTNTPYYNISGKKRLRKNSARMRVRKVLAGYRDWIIN